MTIAGQLLERQNELSQALALAILTKAARVKKDLDWRRWLREIFPSYVTQDFSPRHVEFWEWTQRLRPSLRPPALIAIWPRGGGKSTSVELAVIRIGARKARRYVWYCCEVQDQADKHVETISSMLETKTVEAAYPELATRMVGKYGSSKGWRRSRLRTASGLTVDAIGLDTAARGAKVEEQRPDLIVMDDVDGKHDSPATIKKKIEIITNSLLPAGSNDCAILFVQNVIHPDSIAAQLVDGRADFIMDRKVSGPYPAVDGLTYEQREGKFYITGGVASWEGQNLQVCQEQINTWGLTAFLQEAQHEVSAPPGGIWDHIEFRHCNFGEIPDLVRGCVWVDPAVTATDQSDSMGIQADGIDSSGNIYRIFSWEQITSPESAIRKAILKALELGFDRVGVETDQGGDTWKSVYDQVCRKLGEEKPAILFYPPDPDEELRLKPFPKFASDKAGAGYGSKVERNSQMLTDYEHGRVIHVRGTHDVLERALKRFPLTKPLDLADASFWSWHDLRKPKGVFFR